MNLHFTAEDKLMAAKLARISGIVLDVPTPRRGVKVVDGENRPWEIATVAVLVANRDVTTVQLPRKNDYGEYETFAEHVTGFKVGDKFDALVELDIYKYEIQARAVGDYPLDSETPSFLTGELAEA
jgi:hypothetical protein